MKNPVASGIPTIGDAEREGVVEEIAEEELLILERVNENFFLCFLVLLFI